jgi:peroxiredoxin Q/BCP
MLKLALGTLGLLLALGGNALAADLVVGSPAPAFTLQGSDGKAYTLAQFAGKEGVVLAWFPKAFTGG